MYLKSTVRNYLHVAKYLKSTVRNYLHVAKSIVTKNTLSFFCQTQEKCILTRPDPNSIYQQPYDLF